MCTNSARGLVNSRAISFIVVNTKVRTYILVLVYDGALRVQQSGALHMYTELYYSQHVLIALGCKLKSGIHTRHSPFCQTLSSSLFPLTFSADVRGEWVWSQDYRDIHRKHC